MPTLKGGNGSSAPAKVMILDWHGAIPPYVRWLHQAAIRERAADVYTGGHIAGFHITEQDVAICPDLTDMKMVYLVFEREGRAHGGNSV